MNAKKELMTNRNKILKNYDPTHITNLKRNNDTNKIIKPIYLDDKIEEFIKWDKNMTKYGLYNTPFLTTLIPQHNEEELRNLIEKIAVWYELRYPNQEILGIYNYYECDPDKIKINEEMFVNNPYIKENFNDSNRINKSEIRNLEWDKLFNKEAFFKTLSYKERKLLSKSKYIEKICLKNSDKPIILDKDGKIIKTEIINENLKGLYIKDAIILLEKTDIEKLGEDYDYLRRSIEEIEMKNKFIKQILTCAMYRIIERGKEVVGPYRAFLFAKEFELNKDIPLMYGAVSSNLTEQIILEDLIIREYLQNVGKEELVCYIDYFLKNNRIETISLKERKTIHLNKMLKLTNFD